MKNEIHCNKYGNIQLMEFLSDEDLRLVRMNLYHSESDGCHIFKNFLSPSYVTHIQAFWMSILPRGSSHSQLNSKDDFYQNCPNYFNQNTFGLTYYNFFWNLPVDEVTHDICLRVHMLRNYIEARPVSSELFPYSSRSCSYRIVQTISGEIVVPPHQDYLGSDFDPRRLQATLFLSEHGKDYFGDGLHFMTNSGQEIVFGKNFPVQSGDLVLWRYNNLHGVRNVRTKSGQKGFLRIILPLEITPPEPKKSGQRSAFTSNPPSLSLTDYLQKAKHYLKSQVRP